MKRILGVVGTALVVAFVIQACDGDSFLDSPAQGTLSADVLANQDGVEGNLIAAYSMLDGYGNFGLWGTAASNFQFGGIASDNAYKGSEPGDQQPLTDIEFYQWSTSGTDGYLNDKWSSLYEAVSRSNATIEQLAAVEEISQSERDRILGEALFLRAHYHFEAWKMWENIPYYTEEDDDFRKANTGNDPIALIIADLDQAISLLPITQDEIGRVARWDAIAYKGRVQVYSGDYSGGLTTLRNVQANGPFELSDNFHDVFSAAEENDTETILAYQASVNDGEPNGANGNWPDRLNFPHSGSPFGCCGFYQPSQNLVNAFKVNPANGLPLPLEDPANWNSDDANFDASRTEPVDPRLDWTVGRDGVPFLNWGPHAPGWIRDRAWAGGYSQKKTVYEDGVGAESSVGWSSYQLHSQNLHLYRYADALLLLAEAEVEAGTLENARAIINQIRTRAAQAAQGPDGGAIEVPINDPSITHANYQIGTYDQVWTNQAAARAAVRMERRLELAMEGHRYFDLRRWGVAQDVLNNYLAVEQNRREYLTGADQFTDRHNLYPLPSQQINLSEVEGEDRLVQNPGW